MPCKSFDELIEPIDVVIGGKTYSVKKVTPVMLSEIAKVSQNVSDNNVLIAEQFIILTGADRKEVEAMDARILVAAVSYILEEINKSVPALKNSLAPSETK